MRPILLEMTAFGSYAEKTVVPFSELKHGLYLVTGDTGAGKTTIFDAIMFALYGAASGQDRMPDMMHCDYAEKSTDTVVRLVFSQNGKEYAVTRSIHFPKKRGAEGQYGDHSIDALLEEPDAAPTAGANRVTARCEELIGLDREQFRKIVMLAQGEFREFLIADSSKKNDILGKLFDNSAYLYYQNLLSGARDELRRRRSEIRDELRNLMQNSFSLPEEYAADAERYLPDHPQLRENLAALVAAEEERLAGYGRERDAARADADALNTQKGAAEELNRQFAEFESRRRHESELARQTEEIDARRVRLEKADAALHIAQPKIERCADAQRELDTVRKNIAELRQKLSESSEAAAQAQALADGDDENRAKAEALEAEIRRIELQMPDYRALQSETEARDAGEKASAAARIAREADEKILAGAVESIDRLKETLSSLEDIELRAEQCKAAYEAAQKRLSALTGPGGLRDSIRRLRAAESELAEKERALRAAAETALAAERSHHVLYQRFIAGQAGLLADRLARDLQELGQAECPVCRTKLCKEHIPALAPLRGETPTQAQVDEAKKNYDSAETHRRAIEKSADTLRTSITERQAALLDRAAAVLPVAGWEELTDDARLDAAENALASDAASAAEKLDAARQQQEEKLRRKAELDRLEAELPRLRQTIAESTAAEQSAAAEVSAHDAVLGQLRERLAFESEEAAEARKEALEDEKNSVLALLQQHLDALMKANEQHSIAEAMLRERENSLPKLETAAAEALRAMDAAIASAGFADAAEVEAALLPLCGSDGEEWLAAERDALNVYDSDVRHTREEIARLAGHLAEKEPVDAEALSDRLLAAEGVYAAANARFIEMSALLQGHRNVHAQACSRLDRLAATESAWARIERLGDLAAGTAGDGGKLSFDRYVMGTVFREILDMANHRLDIMSGGRYELLHRTDADRRNARAGLEIDVLDLRTGQRRSSGSLSGGETFITSLALALGLSDAVQNHAGGKPLDALFIDEGFGSLSDDVLDKALDILNQLTEGDRLVGVISHVDKLGESIPQKIRVRNTGRGSTLTVESA